MSVGEFAMQQFYTSIKERKVVLDTETTGKSENGTPGDHRIIEIGCVELIGRKFTGRKLQLYINPERLVDPEAFAVHHISDEFLQDKPIFHDVFQEFYDFIQGAELLIHNAKFDVGFIDNEFALDHRSLKVENICEVTDTLALARKIYPGQKVSLDALCSKLGVDSSSRTSHGALLDAEILAEVFLSLTGGQTDLGFSQLDNLAGDKCDRSKIIGDKKLKVIAPDGVELADHYVFLMELSNKNEHIAFGDEFLIPKEEGAKKIKPEQIDAKLKEMLTEEQYQQYQAVLAERKAIKEAHPLSGIVDYRAGSIHEQEFKHNG